MLKVRALPGSPTSYSRKGLLTSHNGGIYHDDREALEALNLVAQALGQSLTVQVIE